MLLLLLLVVVVVVLLLLLLSAPLVVQNITSHQVRTRRRRTSALSRPRVSARRGSVLDRRRRR